MKKIILITMLLLTSMLIATTYTVKQNGTGDFTTIQAAIDFVVDDDEIIVYEGTYNEQIYFLGKNILVASRYHTTGNEQYIDNTVISYQSNPFLGVVNFSNGEIYTELKGFTIQDGYIGVNFSNCDFPKIKNCIITENTKGIFIRLAGGPTFPNPNIIDNKIINNEDVGVFCADDTYPNIVGNLIESNNVGIYSCGVEINEEVRFCFPTINGNKFENNTTGTGITFERTVAEINGNLFVNQQYVFSMIGAANLVSFNNCTIYDNYQLMIGALIEIPVTNSIIRDLTILPIPQNFQINYSNIEGGYTGIGNIDEDPFFEDPANNDFSLKWTETQKSPCIDTGDPNSPLDPDGSRVDMGAYYKDHDIKTYEFEGINGVHDGWTWLSFDILDIYNVGQTNIVDELWTPIQWSTEIGKHEDLNFIFLNPNWTNGVHQVISPEGFKVKMESESDQIEVSGFRCPANTTFTLYAQLGGDWIGYFIEKPQHVYDAFDGYLDNIYMIKHQDWSIKSGSGVGGWPDVPYTLVPGDMVIVWCDNDIPLFSWIDQEESEKYTVPKVQDFVYTEEADYIPIYIDIDPTNLPNEIGVMLDGECKGATVVTDTLADICAYVTEAQGGNLEFEFCYDNRGTNVRVKEYTVYEPTTDFRETTKIDLKDKQEYYYVSFRPPLGNNSVDPPVNLSASNYPNPFNPTTTISYDLPSDGKIELSIYNIRGQQVKTLIKGEQIAGSYEVVWNGKDNNEKSVSSGLYFYKLSTKDETIMKKILMLK